MFNKKFVIISSLTFFFFYSSVNAKTLEFGKKIFFENCNVCHNGGDNIIIPEKNLKKEALRTNGMDNIQSVIYQVINGKNGMPAFGGRLSEEEIENVATYVLHQAQINFEGN